MEWTHLPLIPAEAGIRLESTDTSPKTAGSPLSRGRADRSSRIDLGELALGAPFESSAVVSIA